MSLYEIQLFMSLLGFGMVTMLATFIGVELCLVKSRFKHTRDKCESKRLMSFRCLIFILSEMCGLLILLCLLPLGHELW